MLSDIDKCLSNDTRYWIGRQLITDKDDYDMTIDVIQNEYKTIGELHHILSAQLESFPTLKLKHLP